MKFRGWLGALAIAAIAMAPSAALAQAAKTDDSTLDNRIEARIKASDTLKHDNIDVSVENGVVTLTGKVASEAHKTRAGIAREDHGRHQRRQQARHRHDARREGRQGRREDRKGRGHGRHRDEERRGEDQGRDGEGR